jgi:hypothetical protein
MVSKQKPRKGLLSFVLLRLTAYPLLFFNIKIMRR